MNITLVAIGVIGIVLGGGLVLSRRPLNRWNIRAWKKMLVQPSVIKSDDQLDTGRITLVVGSLIGVGSVFLLLIGLVGH